jgi:hypothetical protein
MPRPDVNRPGPRASNNRSREATATRTGGTAGGNFVPALGQFLGSSAGCRRR